LRSTARISQDRLSIWS